MGTVFPQRAPRGSSLTERNSRATCEVRRNLCFRDHACQLGFINAKRPTAGIYYSELREFLTTRRKKLRSSIIPFVLQARLKPGTVPQARQNEKGKNRESSLFFLSVLQAFPLGLQRNVVSCPTVN